jgi:hypothetical protein
LDHFKFAKTIHIFMLEMSDPGGRPGYGSGEICNNYAYYSRKVESAPDPGRKALEYRSGSGKMADPTEPAFGSGSEFANWQFLCIPYVGTVNYSSTSVPLPDPLHFGVDPDLRIHASD